ncbi:MAG: hypothetical protein HYZ17_12375 [Betaproteobacteria bacterium]|nr:hypothetical protein [Betaproteobacteria bacterium]
MKAPFCGRLALLAALSFPGHWAAANHAGHDAPAHERHGAPAQAPATNAVAKEAVPAGARPRHEAKIWTRLPNIQTAGRGERNTVKLKVFGMDATELTVYAPGGPAERMRVSYPLGAEGASISSAAPGMGNYHWVIARGETPEEVRVASTAWYFSNPGDAPTRLLREIRHELEIIPQPLPREHASYRESEKWRFLVRWQGQALPRQAVHLETELGTRMSVLTDEQGVATVVFPRDQRPNPAPAKEHARPPRSKFVLAAEKEEGGRRYITAFNYQYGPDPDRQRDLAWGAGFAVLGMVAALPLLRRRQIAAAGEKPNA